MDGRGRASTTLRTCGRSSWRRKCQRRPRTHGADWHRHQPRGHCDRGALRPPWRIPRSCMMRLRGALRQQRRREAGMSGELSRRETLKQAMALAAALSVPDWVLPALAQGEVDVPFTDVPDTFNPRPADGNRRSLDLRAIDGPITPNDQFFFIQHYDRPEIDGATYKLKLTGLVDRPVELSLADIKGMKPVDIVCGYECSGNSPGAMQGLSSNAKFTGVRLRDVLKRAGVQEKAREVVFFGTDRGNEDVVFRQNTFKVQQQFARSIT